MGDFAEWLREQAALYRRQWHGFDESIVGDTAERLDAAAEHIEQLETALRRIVASGAYPEAAIAAEALDGAP